MTAAPRRARPATSAADESLGAYAYREIWRRIVHLDYAPLEVLNEKPLSEELGVGLTPVREALRRLEHDGLVMILPRRGTLTTEISLSAIQWETEIRVELEGLAARLAATRGSEQEHHDFTAVVEELEKVAERGGEQHTRMRFTDFDSQLHHMIYAQTRNPSLIADLHRHLAHALRIWFYCHRLQPTSDEQLSLETYSTEGYRKMAEALRARDGAAAERLMRDHVRGDTEHALAMLRELDPR